MNDLIYFLGVSTTKFYFCDNLFVWDYYILMVWNIILVFALLV